MLSLFMVQLSHPYMTIGNTIALIIWTFLSKWCLFLSSHQRQLFWLILSRVVPPVASRCCVHSRDASALHLLLVSSRLHLLSQPCLGLVAASVIGPGPLFSAGTCFSGNYQCCPPGFALRKPSSSQWERLCVWPHKHHLAPWHLQPRPS